MAATTYGTNAPEAVKLFSRKLYREALKNTTLFKFMGSNSNSVIQTMDDMAKGPGDKLTTQLRVQLSGAGISGDSTLEGNEEALTTYTDSFVIDQLRHAVRSGGRMTEQRIPWSVRAEAEMGLRDWWADRIDTTLFNQLAGNTAVTDIRYTGLQAASAATTNRKYFPNSKAVTTLSAADTFSLTVIDEVKERMKVSTPLVRPITMGGNEYYMCIIHPYQVTSLRTNTNTGQWNDIQQSAMKGGQITSNPLFTGALGVYNNVILYENTRIPLGINGAATVANTRAALFLGAQAAVFGTGRGDSPDRMTWVEELFDYQNQLGVSAGMIFGAKKTVFNSEDFGVIAATTYAAAS